MPRIENLDAKVRDGLRQQILSGKLGDGAHLSELKISKEFDVSRTPVREALCALAADGLVEMIPHRGAFVKEVKQATTANTYEAYSYLMGAYAGSACANGTIESKMAIEAAINTAKNATGEAFTNSVQSMFETFSAAASNPVLDEAMTVVTRRFTGSPSWQTSTTAQNQLATLASAFKQNDATTATTTLQQFVQTISA